MLLAPPTLLLFGLLGCAGGGVDTTELLEGGGSGCHGVAGRLRYTVLVLDASSAGRSSRSPVVISPAAWQQVPACRRIRSSHYSSGLLLSGPLVSIR